MGYCSDDEAYKRIVLDAKKQSEKPKNPHGRGPAVATIQKQQDQAVPQMQHCCIIAVLLLKSVSVGVTGALTAPFLGW